MKHRTEAIEGLTLDRLLKDAAPMGAVFLSRKGRIRYVLMHADDGDQEVCALRNNPEFMAYLEQCTERALKGPRYTLEDVKARLGLNKKSERAPGNDRKGPARRARKQARPA